MRTKQLHDGEVFDYIVDAYAGTQCVGVRNVARRIFAWIENDTVYEGNIEAFAQHLVARFELEVTPRSVVVAIHELLLELGERIRKPRQTPLKPKHVEKRYPDPEQWVVAHVRTS